LDNFIAYAVAKENQPLIDALNSGLDAVVADRQQAPSAAAANPPRKNRSSWLPPRR
jgi:polar amino acid transport system substrate-binding protein